MHTGEGVMMMDSYREMFEAATALTELGYWVRVESAFGVLTVFRDGVEIGRLRFPVEAEEPPR